jgi:NADPH:quinone reductase-like Zn-dependent oxidoreductase
MRAIVMTDFGPPELLVSADVEIGRPEDGQILIDVAYAGVGPTDLAIRAGHLGGAFGAAPGAILGFEVSGVVSAVGSGVSDVRPGDPVAAFLPELGGYAEQVLARYWVRRPDAVTEQDAAALPASAEAAARVLDETQVTKGETVLIVGAAGSVGLVATQLAMIRGAQVIAAVRESDFAAVEALGAVPVAYGPDLAAHVRQHVPSVDAVVDASGAGVLAAAVELAGGAQRVVTLSDPHASEFGVHLSVPDEAHIADRLDSVMTLLAAGRFRLQPQSTAPLAEAAAVHRALQSKQLRAKVLLTVNH